MSLTSRTNSFRCLGTGNSTSFVILALMITLLSGILTLMDNVTFVGALVIVLLSFYLFLLVYMQRDKFLLAITSISFGIRFLFSIANLYIWVFPSGRNDAIHFENSGWNIASSSENIAAILTAPTEFYRRLIAIVYYIIGRNPLVIQHISVIAGTTLVVLTYKIVRELTPYKRTAQVASFGVALYPSLVQFSIFTRRESLIYCFTAFSLLFFLRWVNKGRLLDFLKASLFLVISAIFHSAIIFGGIPFIFLYISYKPKVGTWTVSPSKISVSILLLALVVAFGGELFRKIPELTVEDLESSVVRKSARGRAGYLQGTLPSSWLEAMVQTPLRVIYFFFTPFPWWISNSSDLYGFFLDTLPVYIIAFFSYKGLAELRKEKKVMFLALVCFLMFLVVPFSWGTANYGTAIRHRQKVIWLLIAIASYGYSLKGRTKIRVSDK